MVSIMNLAPTVLLPPAFAYLGLLHKLEVLLADRDHQDGIRGSERLQGCKCNRRGDDLFLGHPAGELKDADLHPRPIPDLGNRTTTVMTTIRAGRIRAVGGAMPFLC
jgi:hypothetical protein